MDADKSSHNAKSRPIVQPLEHHQGPRYALDDLLLLLRE